MFFSVLNVSAKFSVFMLLNVIPINTKKKKDKIKNKKELKELSNVSASKKLLKSRNLKITSIDYVKNSF